VTSYLFDQGLTIAQQNPSQQISSEVQKVLPQQVEPFGLQNGATLLELAIQHSSVYLISRTVYLLIE